MEGIELEGFDQFPDSPTGDFCESILRHFSKSDQEDNQRLCATVGAMAQELKEQGLPLTPVAYFGATCSSLDRLSSEPDSPPHVVQSLTTILSLLLPRIPVAVLKKKGDFVSKIVVTVLRLDSVTEVTVTSGLKCLAQLLIAGDKVNWSDISQNYSVVIGNLTDSHSKVRRQSHLCIRDILQSFRGMPVLPLASEAISNMFERFLLLAGGSNANSSEGAKGAQEVLYVLDALKDTIPLMSMKYMTTILKYYKTLLEFRQPLVTRRVTNSLNAVCTYPNVEVSAEALLDSLSLLALSISANETSPVSMTFNARLLSSGMMKVYSLNRQLCVIKLPVMFSALKDIIGSEHEEAIFSATEAFKTLINGCIDEGLIKQGVDQIINSKSDDRKSGPTIIEKVCAIVESLLDYHYSAVWDMSFQVVSTMFDKLGYYSSYFMKGTLKNLADMQSLPDKDFPYKNQLHECVGCALGAMGPETFLGILSLNFEANDLSDVNDWLFPILKQHIIGAHLSFFSETLLGLVGEMKQRSRKLELEGKVRSSSIADGFVYKVWSLLPSFCNYPLDTAKSFKELLSPICSALHDEHDLRGKICSSLQILIQQNKKIKEGKDDLDVAELSPAQLRAVSHYTPEIARENLKVLSAPAPQLLSLLSGIFMESTVDEGGSLQSTIGEFASIAHENVVRTLFKKTMQRLLKVTQEAGMAEASKSNNSMQVDESSSKSSLSLQRARLFDLAVSLLPGLDEPSLDVLFSAIKPALQDVDGLIQKKAYKVLSIILRNQNGFLSAKLEDLLKLMIEVLPSLHFSAKRHRLDCLHHLITYASKEDLNLRRHEILSSFLTEIILALKEANKRTRNRAYEVLVQIGHEYGDQDDSGQREQLFNMVATGLAGKTPHMISAAVKGLARLAYEFSDLVSSAYKLLPSTFLLLQRKNREIIKANLGLLKVLVAKSKAEGLEAHLASLVEGLLKWQDDTKNHFKAKVKLLLEMLVRKCGIDAVKAVMPEEHMKLLTNIRKINERKEKKQAAGSVESKSHLSKATTSRLSRWNHTKIFSDFDDGDSGVEMASDQKSRASSKLKSKAASLRSKKTRRADKSLPEDLFDQLEDEPLDLLDRHKTRSALQSSSNLKRKQDSDDEPEFNPDGRLIIHEGKKPKKATASDADSDKRSEAQSHFSVGASRNNNQKRRKTSESGWAYTGSEYGSKKADGDVKRKDKLEPYAYWPLDRKMMSRRPEHRATARKGLSSVVKLTKKLEGKSASAALSAKFMKFKKKSGKKKR
ncbi:ARM repeat superfamily protein isoform 4 [Hibiscus syriacus]|uniref:ARM repeat superfamily protein isoform 4 n=1 Tax=Hibiscus syriacus TaxID=106335 RepID=A0A6A2XHR2_HIBSY|nr:RRP12-like protein [Hibiscus syriacus]KAE8675058.1 ARM repeat superfamily protein isoform 4 [Hibiscus syriacus]